MKLKNIEEIIKHIGPINPLSVHYSLFKDLIDLDDFRRHETSYDRTYLHIKFNDLAKKFDDSFKELLEDESFESITGSELQEKCVEIFKQAILTGKTFDPECDYLINYKNIDELSRHNNGIDCNLTSLEPLIRPETDEEVFSRIESRINSYYKPYHEEWSTFQLLKRNLSHINEENRETILELYIDGLDNNDIKKFIIRKRKNNE